VVKDDALKVYKDKNTKCKYLIYDGYREDGITPLLKSDGTPDCK
jgi:hypothetical protein